MVLGYFVRILESQKEVACAICIGGVMHGGGLLAPNMVSLLAASLLSIHEHGLIFKSIRGLCVLIVVRLWLV